MFKSIKRFLLFFITSSNHSFMINHGYLPKKIGFKEAYSNGQCAWFYDTVSETPFWILKRKIKEQMKLFDGCPVKFKLINQYRAWGWHDTEILETTDINLISSEYEKHFKEYISSHDHPNPCIHIYKGNARIGVFKGFLSSKEYVKRELTSMLEYT